MTLRPLHRIILAAVVFAAGRLAPAQAPPDAKAEIGKPVPAFTLNDLDGRPFKLADYRDKVVVLQWFNSECPFVASVFRNGTVKRTLEEIKTLGDDYVYVAVNSTATTPKDELVQKSRTFLNEFQTKLRVLIDADAAVARRFDARTTPQVFIIDRGVLRYSGAYTNNPWGRGPSIKNHVIDALRQIKEGKKVDPEYVRPWGCSVKYK